MFEKDYADNKVVGMDRYFPTKRSWVLLLLMITAPPTALQFSISHPNAEELSRFFGEKWLLALFIASVTGFLSSILLVIELAIVVNHSKHFPVFHSTNRNELMSFRWLYRNSSSKHFIFIVTICVISFYAGYCIAKY